MCAYPVLGKASPRETDIKVYINDIDFNTDGSWYPVFENENIIYIPLYEYTCSVLNITKPVFDENVIYVDEKDIYSSPIGYIDISGGGMFMTSGGYATSGPTLNPFYRYKPYYEIAQSRNGVSTACLPKQDIIYLAGKEIDNKNEIFPFLEYDNQLYLPLTWENCINRLGWNYSYNAEECAIHINCNTQFKNRDEFVYINGNVKAKIVHTEIDSRFRDAPGNDQIRRWHLYIALDGDNYKEIDYTFSDKNGVKEFWNIGEDGNNPNFAYSNGIISVNAQIKNTDADVERINVDASSGKIISVVSYIAPSNPLFIYNDYYCYPYVEIFDEYDISTDTMIELLLPLKDAILKNGTSEHEYYFMSRRAKRRGKIKLNGKSVDFYTYNYDTGVYIRCEDLAYFGYDMFWNPNTRTTTLTKNCQKDWVDYEEQPYDKNEEYLIYESDCKIILDGKEISRCYNIGGYTLIPLYELYGKFEISM